MKFYIYKTTDPVTIKEIYTERMSEDYISSHNLTEIVYEGSHNTVTFDLTEDGTVLEVTQDIIMARMNAGELPE
jgi:hypothetical protein